MCCFKEEEDGKDVEKMHFVSEKNSIHRSLLFSSTDNVSEHYPLEVNEFLILYYLYYLRVETG